MANKYKYSTRVLRSLNATAKRDIMQSQQSTSSLRKEIARVFQRANRRIQNIETSGVFSPALLALGELPTGFTKFGMSNKSWTQIKMDYGKAINFLSQPTSSATGSKEYSNQVKARYNLSDSEFKGLVREYSTKLSSLTGTSFVEMYLKSYKDYAGDFEREVQSAAAQLENDAVNMQMALENSVVKSADEVGDVFENDVDSLFEIF